MARILIFLALLVLAFSRQQVIYSNLNELTTFWTEFARDVVDPADLDFVVKSLLACRIDDLTTLKTVSRTDLCTCGMSLGDAARIKAKADLPTDTTPAVESAPTVKSAPAAVKSAPATAPAAVKSTPTTAPAVKSTPVATVAFTPAKSVMSEGDITLTETNTLTQEVAQVTQSATTVSISIQINNQTVDSGLVTTEPVANEPVNQVSGRRKRSIPVEIDWRSILVGVANAGDIPRVSSILRSHGLDFSSIIALDVTGLQSLGIDREIAVRLLTKIFMTKWLRGVVSDKDIPAAITSLLKCRHYLPVIRKISINELASCGIALGDATRIYTKAHPDLVARANGRPYHIETLAGATNEDPVTENDAAQPTGSTATTTDVPAGTLTPATPVPDATVGVPIIVKIILASNGETVTSNVSTSTTATNAASTVPVTIQLGGESVDEPGDVALLPEEEELLPEEEDELLPEEELALPEEELALPEEELALPEEGLPIVTTRRNIRRNAGGNAGVGKRNVIRKPMIQHRQKFIRRF